MVCCDSCKIGEVSWLKNGVVLLLGVDMLVASGMLKMGVMVSVKSWDLKGEYFKEIIEF
jgi:hypothetical protein